MKNKSHHLFEVWHQWLNQYHSDGLTTITFQCKELYSNVVFNSKSLHALRNNFKGFENLPDTIENPQECWSYWANPEKQTDVYRNYIKGNYVVNTLDSVVQWAMLVDDIEKYKKGCPLIF